MKIVYISVIYLIAVLANRYMSKKEYYWYTPYSIIVCLVFTVYLLFCV